MKTISETIEQTLREPKYPFHMPGHKRNAEACCQGDFCQYDFTEIDGFDNLYAPAGIILESERRAAALFGADRTFYLVNGSTAGIIAAILAAADGNTSGTGAKILVAPDAHKSVYHALALGGITGVNCDGEVIFDGGGKDETAGIIHVGTPGLRAALTDLNSLSEALDYDRLPARIESVLNAQPDIKAIVVTSPNYEGIVSNIARIAAIAHSRGAVLIVDEAHGTHFGMDPYFPENSNRLGADIVIHSMHKTMCALTQTALLHVNGDSSDAPENDGLNGGSSDASENDDLNGGLVDSDTVLAKLQMIQTSSPSYLLMKSIDDCVSLLADRGPSLFAAYVRRLRAIRARVSALEHVALFDGGNIGPMRRVVTDPGKLVITVRGNEAADEAPFIDARDIYRALREEFGIQPEFAQRDHVLAMTSFADTDEGFDRLAAALEEIDRRIAAGESVYRENGVLEADIAAGAEPVAKTDCYEA